MNNLLNFLLRHINWVVFIVYMGICSALLFPSNPYQKYIMLSSTNAVNSKVYSGVNSVTSYFSLRDINEQLLHRNFDLEMEILLLK